MAGSSITVKLAGDRPRTTGSGANVRVIQGVSAEMYLSYLEGPLTSELERRYPGASITVRAASTAAIELVGLKPVEDIRSEIGELIGELLADFEAPEEH